MPVCKSSWIGSLAQVKLIQSQNHSFICSMCLKTERTKAQFCLTGHVAETKNVYPGFLFKAGYWLFLLPVLQLVTGLSVH